MDGIPEKNPPEDNPPEINPPESNPPESSSPDSSPSENNSSESSPPESSPPESSPPESSKPPWSFKKQFIFTVIGIAVMFATYSIIVFNFSISKNHFSPESFSNYDQPLESSVVPTIPITYNYKCPKDFCNSWVLGSCIGKNERYRERECYDYPDKDLDLSSCEANRRIYYEKGSQLDGTC